MSRDRFDGIQQLRAIAVLLVVLCHMEMTLARPQYVGFDVAGGWLTAGAIGVDLFFVVSGFIMFHTTDGLTAGPGRAARFMANRAIRILPFMWCCVLMYLAIALALHGRGVDLWPYLRSMLLYPVGELAPWEVWSLRHEMLFYAVVACALWGRSGRIILGVFIVGAVPSGWWIDRGPKGPVEPWLAVLWSPRANLAFGAGLLVGWLHRGWPVPLQVRQAPWAPGVLLCSAPLLLALGEAMPATVVGERLPVGLPSDLQRAILLVPVLGAMVYCGALIEPARGWHGRLVVGVGDASYSIYLTHIVFITAMAKLVAAGGLRLSPWVTVLVAVPLALAAGWLVHRWVERPLLRHLRARWLAKPSTR